jgi:hypothetical protein
VAERIGDLGPAPGQVEGGGHTLILLENSAGASMRRIPRSIRQRRGGEPP